MVHGTRVAHVFDADYFGRHMRACEMLDDVDSSLMM